LGFGPGIPSAISLRSQMPKNLLMDRLLHNAKSVEDVRNPILMPTLKVTYRAVECAELVAQKRRHVDGAHSPRLASAINPFRRIQFRRIHVMVMRWIGYIRSAFVMLAASIRIAPRTKVIVTVCHPIVIWRPTIHWSAR